MVFGIRQLGICSREIRQQTHSHWFPVNRYLVITSLFEWFCMCLFCLVGEIWMYGAYHGSMHVGTMKFDALSQEEEDEVHFIRTKLSEEQRSYKNLLAYHNLFHSGLPQGSKSFFLQYASFSLHVWCILTNSLSPLCEGDNLSRVTRYSCECSDRKGNAAMP